jgi:aminocarboxymuconate-semialdehyde decarboxylase
MIIDVHGHVSSPALLKKFPMPPSLADVDGMLERKAAVGIDITIIGTPVGAGTMMRVPGHDNYAQTADELKAHHDWLAGLVQKHKGRLYSYAYTNPFGDDAMLAESARMVREDGFVGLIANTSVQGRYLDDDACESFWAMAAELDRPVMLHPPAEPAGAGGVGDFRLVEQIARFNDVTMALAAIIFSGRLQQHPNLKLIGATAGGALSLVTNRLDKAYAPAHWGPPGAAPADPDAPPPTSGGPPWARWENKNDRPPTAFLRQIWVDTTNPNIHHHEANVAAFGADRVMFGTDAPPLTSPLEESVAAVTGMGISDADKDRILRGNAEELFGF